ncbi:unnamed protein product, partial [marine sediment metagenome]
MAGYNRPAMKPDEIKASISNPIGIPPIRELAKGKKEVVIIFDDMTRVTRVAKIMPFVLEELAAAGIPDNRIRFIVALGCHGALDRLDFVKKLGEEVVARFPVYNHNPFANCTYVGTTSTYKTKVYVNEEVMGCDLKIAIGSVVPHGGAGFEGKKEVVIIFDDMTRVTRVAKIMPFVLEELAAAGIPDNRIRFIVALGLHSTMWRQHFVKKLGEEVVARFPVYNHNPFYNCTYVGTTSTYKTRVYANEEVMKCDLKIAIGSVVPHPMSGFGGGGKIIMPGVASFETIDY